MSGRDRTAFTSMARGAWREPMTLRGKLLFTFETDIGREIGGLCGIGVGSGGGATAAARTGVFRVRMFATRPREFGGNEFLAGRAGIPVLAGGAGIPGILRLMAKACGCAN
jgi:hypothetical protein